MDGEDALISSPAYGIVNQEVRNGYVSSKLSRENEIEEEFMQSPAYDQLNGEIQNKPENAVDKIQQKNVSKSADEKSSKMQVYENETYQDHDESVPPVDLEQVAVYERLSVMNKADEETKGTGGNDYSSPKSLIASEKPSFVNLQIDETSKKVELPKSANDQKLVGSFAKRHIFVFSAVVSVLFILLACISIAVPLTRTSSSNANAIISKSKYVYAFLLLRTLITY